MSEARASLSADVQPWPADESVSANAWQKAADLMLSFLDEDADDDE